MTTDEIFPRIFQDGNGEGALVQLDELARSGSWTPTAEILRLYALRLVLRVDEAAQAALNQRPAIRAGELSWYLVNGVLDTLVSAGLYEEALSVEHLIPLEARTRATVDLEPVFALTLINFAEAEMNLGRPDAALARLDAAAPAAAGHAVASSALAVQRGWILGSLGRGAEALASLAGGSREGLGPLFAAEFHLSRVFALLAAGDVDGAQADVVEALRHAKRPASTRNALFLRARIADARGDVDSADRLCKEAAEHPHRWQGGDGLVFWGRILMRQDRRPQAAEAFRLAIERDRQSVSAREAKMLRAVVLSS